VFIIQIVENTDVCNVNEWSVILAGNKSAQGMFDFNHIILPPGGKEGEVTRLNQHS